MTGPSRLPRLAARSGGPATGASSTGFALNRPVKQSKASGKAFRHGRRSDGVANLARGVRTVRTVRTVHPGAWWLWALGLGAAATRTTNPLLLALLIGVAAFVVAGRKPAGRTFGFFVRLALFVLAIRLVFEVIFGSTLPGDVVLRLPSVPLPSVLAGLRIGGPVTAQALLAATYGGLQLATLLICVGAANTLASPRRLLRSLPGALYELGVAAAVAVSFAPQLAQAAVRIRRARRLRGRAASGLRGWAGVALPVLQDALDGSIELAAAMDSRGFGRRGPMSRKRRRLTTAAVLVGMLAVAGAGYALLDAGSPMLAGIPLLLAGAVLAAAAVVVGGHGTSRTKYRPDRWGGREWLTVAAGLAALAGVLASGALDPAALHTGSYPIEAPALPWPALVGCGLALLPAGPAAPAGPGEPVLMGASR
jgi:energy-coupling factor transport system permease protein